MEDAHISAAQVAALAGLTRQRVWQLRTGGKMPMPCFWAGRAAMWDRAEVVRWVEERKAPSSATDVLSSATKVLH